MPSDPNAPGNNEAQGEDEVYTREQVEELIQERDRRWQSRLTPLHQERAELRRQNNMLEGRLEAVERTIQHRGNAAAENGRDDDDGVDWKGLAGEAADDLRKAIDKRFDVLSRRNTRTSPAAERGELSPTEERMEAYLLAQEEEKVRERYRGMTEDEMRQILELGVSTGNGDLKYLAFQLFGSPKEWNEGRGGTDPDVAPPRRTPQPVLAGRARAQAAARSQKIVEIPGGAAGYRAADKIAEDFLRKQGHS